MELLTFFAGLALGGAAAGAYVFWRMGGASSPADDRAETQGGGGPGPVKPK